MDSELPVDPAGRQLLQALRAGARNRADLVERTGWSRNTVATRLQKLLDSGWAREDPESQGERGRPSLTYSVNPQAVGVYVATFGWDQLHGAICGFDNEILAGEVVPFRLGALDDAIDAAVAQLARLRAHPNARNVRLAAAIVAGPSPVANPMDLPAWSKVGAVPADFSSRLGVPVAFENDANLMAVGLRRDYPEANSLVFVKIATGIGAGILVGGQLHQGVSGLAGEIGHIPVHGGADLQCACGNKGCLSLVASAPALLRSLSTKTRPVDDMEQLQALVAAGDGDAVAALRTAGRDIGEALVGVLTGIAPEVLVLGGRLTLLGEHLTTGVRESLTRFTLPALSSRIRVTSTNKHRAAGLRGGADLVIEKLLR